MKLPLPAVVRINVSFGMRFVGGSGGGTTVMETVATFEVKVVLLAVKANESGP